MTPADAFVLPVDKPVGPTSHDVVVAARRALGVRKIGHAGTLDPFASGLLLLCVGRATRLAEYLSGLSKSYEAVARLGVTTDTLDLDGEVLEERGGWSELTEAELDDALTAFLGEIDQVPPQYSAKKVDGVAMHRRARAGEHVVLEPCGVEIHEIERLDAELPDLRFRVTCSSGTYVRSLARDVGERLGMGAHLTKLRRTAIGSFDVADALSPDALGDRDAVTGARLEPLAALEAYPSFEVTEEGARRLAHGQRLPISEETVEPAGYIVRGPALIALSRGGELLAVAELVDDVLHPRKVFTP